MSANSVQSVPTDPGTHWVKDPGIVIDAPDDSGNWNVTRLPDGRYRMFYEACDVAAVWRILSCTAAPAQD